MNKTLFSCTILAAGLAFSSCGGGKDEPPTDGKDTTKSTDNSLPVSGDVKKRYGIESGIIEYEYSGSQKGKETLYFTEWGWKEAKYTETEMTVMGISQKTGAIAILDGEMIYNYDMVSKRGTKMKNPLLDQLTEEQLKDLAAVGMAMMKQLGAEKTGTENVAGKDCDVWEIKSMGSKVWVWNNIALKTSMKMAGMEINIVATKVQEGGSVPADKLKFPEGIDPSTFTDMSGQVNKVLKGS